MNRIDFMKQLESLLQNISPAEREEALQYYTEYFNDAGAENEQAVIEALGNPAKVAENIKRDINGAGDAGYQRPQNRAVIQYQQTATSAQQEPPKKESMPTWALVLIIIGAILLSPAALGIAGGLLGTLAGVIIGWFALIFGFGITAVVLFVVLLVLLVTGIMCMWADPLVGVALLGGGLVCGALSLLFLMLTVAMAGIVTPAVFKGICRLCNGKR
ncbi:MAG: DUF1700 domain-containing protein [Acetatifactor sp.]|nr:DUF1700 domain-containing protein [Acetatifactor sp.]MDE7045342.1 DUF1700 domain-containing protein [Acetatifactor sp.]